MTPFEQTLGNSGKENRKRSLAEPEPNSYRTVKVYLVFTHTVK